MAEFRIDRIRFNWKGVWTASTAYIKDDVISYGGKVFVALTNHTASADFNDDLDFLVSGESTPKWEQMGDGRQWKGEWQPEEFYKVNDVVKYRGILYNCIDSHTSATTLSLGLESNDSNWAPFAKGDNYLATWTASTIYKKNDLIKYGGRLYSCVTDHTSNTVELGLEADQAKWAVYNKSDAWQGVWLENTRYKVQDIIRYGGNVYRCIIGHTSNSDIREGVGSDLGDDSTAAKWELVVEGIEFKGAWSGTQWYKTNDIVIYGPNLYIAKRGMSGTDNFDDVSDWDIWVPGLGYEGIWSNNEVYQPGDLVTYGGYTYTSLTINIGSNPSSQGLAQDVGDWEVLVRGYNFKGEWSILNPYAPGDVVRKGGYLYESLVNNLAIELVEPGDPDVEDGNATKWRLIQTGFAWMGEWVESKATEDGDSTLFEYLPGQVVMDESETYICKLQHFSNIREARPKEDTDIQSGAQLYWTKYAGNNETSAENNVLRYTGDIRTYSTKDDGSTAGTSRLAIGPAGELLKVDEDDTLKYDTLFEINKVYYVSAYGEDIPTNGINPAKPFKTVKYACQFLQGNLEARTPATIFIATGMYKELLPIVVPRDTALVGDELRSTVIMPADGYELDNMFYVHNGSGIRNMTLQGLSGTLGNPNDNLTRRPTAGAYVSLDPATGPSAEYAHIVTKSPYVQNVTTFGTGCIGMKVDGDLHTTGNKSIVANDFTQILSDGIGYWANADGKSELVSVFTYYCHIGYLATNGGKVRALNGNNSYGDYGSVAEGFDVEEVPITASVDNRSQQAQIFETFNDGDKIHGVSYTHAGEGYTTAQLDIVGNGVGATATFNEFRTGGVKQIFVTEEDSNFIGGSNYTFKANKAQIGTPTSLTLSGADTGTEADYIGQRLYIHAGKGVGQYAVISGLNTTNKVCTVVKESNGEPGWEHVTGRPIEATINDTARYYIEPRLSVAEPPYQVQSITVGAEEWSDIKRGTRNDADFWVAAHPNGGSISSDGNGFSGFTRSSKSGLVAITTSGAICLVNPDGNNNAGSYSNDAGSTWSDTSLGLSGTQTATGVEAASSNEFCVMTFTDTNSPPTSVKTSTDGGNSWGSATVPAGQYNDVAYGNSRWVIVSGSVASPSNVGAYSDDGNTWVQFTLPASSAWSKVIYGKDRFVAVTNKTDSSTAETAVSFDGITWYAGTMEPGEWTGLAYAQGQYAAVKSDTGATSDVIAFSRDGFHWKTKLMSAGAEIRGGIAGASNSSDYIAVTKTQNNADKITFGCTALGRPIVGSGRIGTVILYETGSGYGASPTVTVFDNKNTLDVTTDAQVANGVLPQPTFTNNGTGYFRATSSINQNGDGFADIVQIADTLILDNVSKLPGPGDNISIQGIDGVTYFVVKILTSTGVLGAYKLKLQISPNLGRKEAPVHGENVTIRQQYSQVRLTGHDFLDIGTGNFSSTSYPGLYVFGYNPDENAEPKQFQEVSQYNGGRVFYTSTDQDGNFRVGELFEVEQATGTISINASFFELDGLEELRLGGVVLGGTGAVVREFSTDPTFAANSNNIVPTQRAIGKYVTQRVSSGGSDLKVNRLNAGDISFEGNRIFKVLGGTIDFTSPVTIQGNVSGDMAAQNYFTSGAAPALGGAPGFGDD
jgi:hypothetical protein